MREAELVGNELVRAARRRDHGDLTFARRQRREAGRRIMRRVGDGDDITLAAALEVIEQRELGVDERAPCLDGAVRIAPAHRPARALHLHDGVMELVANAVGGRAVRCVRDAPGRVEDGGRVVG